MTALSSTNQIFFTQSGINPEKVRNIVTSSLAGADDGELYMEFTANENFNWVDGKMRGASQSKDSGFGMRFVKGDRTGYAYDDTIISNTSLASAISAASTISKYGNTPDTGCGISLSTGTPLVNLYTADNPLDEIPTEQKIKLLKTIEDYARSKTTTDLDGAQISQIQISLAAEWKAVQIIRNDGARMADIRPLVRLNVGVILEKDGRMEQGGYGFGGRHGYADLFNAHAWQGAVDSAVAQAKTNLLSIPAPGGEMTVILGSGWPAVMLHEAVGHGLEGDFNRKGTSAFAKSMNKRVAPDFITVIDQGDMPHLRGSLNFDDEGTPTRENVLIENGILRSYMQDRMNARLMGVAPTGNGRRQDYSSAPIPRMTVTYMKNGAHEPQEIIQSVDRGIYAVSFAGGTVDITSGNYNFAANEAYLIENGKVTTPLKGVNLIGNGPRDMAENITMLGNDMTLDKGVGTCGKEGQGVPVGLGQPTLRMDNITVGGANGPS